MAVFFSLISTVGVIFCLRYEFAILIPKTDKEAANLVCLCILIVAVLSFLSILVLFFVGDYLIHLLQSPQLKIYLWLIPPTLFVIGIFQTMIYWNTRTKHFIRLSLAKGANAVVVSGTQIGLGIGGYAFSGSLIGAYVLGQIISCIVLSFQVLHDHYIFLRDNVSKEGIIIQMRRFTNFPIFDTWSAFLGSISGTLPIFLLSIFFNQSVVGYYSLGMIVIQLPLSFIGASISQVFFQRASTLRHESERQLSDFVEKMTLRLMIIGLFPAILFLLAGPALFSIIFGPQWAEAGVYCQIFVIWMYFMLITSPLSPLFPIFEQQKLTLVFTIVTIILRTIALTVGGIVGNVMLALALFSFVSFLSYATSFIWMLHLSKVSLKILIKKIIWSCSCN
jgi:O-antigen/teichoic acid export membrane protein